MTPTDPYHTLRRWLRAEREDDAAKAEAALVRLMAVLPRRAPASGFADRVLARALSILETPILEARGVPTASGLSDRFRYFAAAALLFTGLGLAALARVLYAWLSPVVDSAVAGAENVSLLAALMSFGAQRMIDGLMLWQRALGFQRGLPALLETPEIALSALFALFLCAAAFLGLRQLLAGERKIDASV